MLKRRILLVLRDKKISGDQKTTAQVVQLLQQTHPLKAIALVYSPLIPPTATSAPFASFIIFFFSS